MEPLACTPFSATLSLNGHLLFWFPLLPFLSTNPSQTSTGPVYKNPPTSIPGRFNSLSSYRPGAMPCECERCGEGGEAKDPR